jgi:hypothetical protein
MMQGWDTKKKVGSKAMGQFDCLTGVFELARIHRGVKDRVTLKYDEYLEYLSIWNDLPNSAQILLMKKVLKK